ncbi:MAG TPA: Hsp70 family protein, partial [Candidatus Acidoferrales bacterium]
SEVFSTAADNQTSVEIHVLQGERPVASGNRTLGKFQLVGIPPAPRGLPQVEVTFDIDANGILNVSAKDTATNKEQKITITSSTGLTKEEADRLAKEAEAHASEDKQRVAEVDARNRLDSMVYQTEKLLKENREKLSDADAKAAEEAVAEGRSALSEGKLDRLNAALEGLTKASHRIAETLYKSQQAAGASAAAGNPGPSGGAGAPGAGGQQPGGQGDVVDAEFVDVDESKRAN